VEVIKRAWVWIMDNIKVDLQRIHWWSLDFAQNRDRFWRTYGFFTMQRIYWPAGKLLAFQEEICSTEFVCWLFENKDSLRRSRKSHTQTHTHTHTHTSCRNEIPPTAVKYIL